MLIYLLSNQFMIGWHPNVLQFLLAADYPSVIHYYEQLLEQEFVSFTNYWYLGLAYLLNEEEEPAQTIWMMAITQAPELQIESLTEELVTVLHQEAERQLRVNDKPKSWLIRSHLRGVNPSELANILLLILLEIELDIFTPENISIYEVCSLLEQKKSESVDIEQLFKTVQNVLKYPALESINLAKSSLVHASPVEQWMEMLIQAAKDLGYGQNSPLLGIELIYLCLQLRPNALEALEHLPRLHLEAHQYQEAIQTATHFYECCNTVDSQFFSNALLLKSMLSAGAWNNIAPVANRHKTLLRQLIETQPTLNLRDIKALVVYTGYVFYLQDSLQENRWLQNEAGKLFHRNLVANTSIEIPLSRRNLYSFEKKRPLKIGYIAHTLKAHSVGWLCRWLFKYHDRNEFALSLYLFEQDPDDPFFAEWFGPNIDAAHFFRDDIPAAAEKICDDNIDILIDLDSITLDHTVTVMGLKPALIQASWLGWDASGLPTVDYFIADPYVLPTDADQHYHEKILRLPQTYIAVNGFEIDVPTLKRSDLGISADSVVYYSSQVGMKRHPETIQMQLQIIKEVPNSYFLIKGLADQSLIQEMFLDLAMTMGIAAERLKFLPMMPTEMVHRANLGIADVVLDTFPYNGATTTLETLWMGIPLVTRVGTQFAARNSYSFLMNVGVTEGIAWNAEEYVEWGIRFGFDLPLRLDVAWKLRQSRKTSPLWNTKRFTHNMEQAYRSMWHNYVESHPSCA
jgi:predicted O-linked N-acetylglucosamine transferase (SPINDLY family)